MKKTTITFLVSALLLINGLKAQTIQEGMNHLYANRFKSAITVFEKLLAINPNNMEAIYWLGQIYLEMDEIMGARIALAKKLYEKALMSNGNAPLVLVGMGHVELLENKTSEARQRFETALTMTHTKKGDDPVILTAIGRANADAKAGDFNYAIPLLESAVARDPKNTETLLQLGNAYRKAKPGEGGGQAYQSYNKALGLDPSFAIASLRLAKLFESQKNWELVFQYLNESVTKDPRFSVGYYELFYYYFFRAKFPEAEEQLKKYIDSKLPETDIQDQYLYAQLCWARKDFDCAVTKAQTVIASMGDLTKPKVYRLMADAFFQRGDTLNKKGDSINAKNSFTNAKKYSDDFFGKKNPDDIISNDFRLRADILSKTGGTSDEIYNTYIKGAELDTVLTSKIDFIKKGAEYFKAKGDSISRVKEGDLRVAIIKLKPNPGQRDMFDAGFAYYQGKDYLKSIDQFTLYTQKFPDETFGWEWIMNNYRVLDSTMEKGLAVPAATRLFEVADKDREKNKKSFMSAAGYLAAYNANVVKDKQKAIEYLKKMLEVDPANQDIQNNINVLEKAPATKPPKTGGTKPAPDAKPNSTSALKSTLKKTTIKKTVKK